MRLVDQPALRADVCSSGSLMMGILAEYVVGKRERERERERKNRYVEAGKLRGLPAAQAIYLSTYQTHYTYTFLHATMAVLR